MKKWNVGCIWKNWQQRLQRSREDFMTIQKLHPKDYQGKEFVLKYSTTGYYDIEKSEEGFQITYKKFESVKEMSFKDIFFNEWLEEPVAYGAFEGEKLLGYVEGTLEKWNNRYRISNICIFEEECRNCGIGTQLMNNILEEARLSGAGNKTLWNWR